MPSKRVPLEETHQNNIPTQENTQHNLASKAQKSKALTLFFVASMLALFIFNQIFSTHNINWTALILQSLPLALLLPSLIGNHYRAYSWLCFIMLLYFIFAVMNALISTANITDYLFLSLTILTFTAAMMASRWLQRVYKQTP